MSRGAIPFSDPNYRLSARNAANEAALGELGSTELPSGISGKIEKERLYEETRNTSPKVYLGSIRPPDEGIADLVSEQQISQSGRVHKAHGRKGDPPAVNMATRIAVTLFRSNSFL